MKSSYYFEFRLINNRIIKFETFADGNNSGLRVSEVNNPEAKVKASFPIAKLKLDSRDKAVVLKSKEVKTDSELPNSFKKFIAGPQPKKRDYIYTAIFMIIVCFFFYLIFF